MVRIPTYQIATNQISARRFAYAKTVEIPPGRSQVRARCGVDICVNPGHAEHSRSTGELLHQSKLRLARKHRANNPEQYKAYQAYARLSKYGLSKSDFEKMLSDQNGECAICQVSFCDSTHATRACIDHCHDTNRVRGLLCSRCNSGIGHLKDDLRLLRSAADYLIKYGASEES